jgi:pSer/pThr/pTyr-binding forkhead associated (FHA) protein
VIQLSILTGRKADTRMVSRSFPFSIGRAAGSSLVLDDPGVWDQHLEIDCAADEIKLSVCTDAVATLNGEPIREGRLRDGDQIGLGQVNLRFSFSPMRQRGLRFREALTWLALAAVSLGQVAIIYLLAE